MARLSHYILALLMAYMALAGLVPGGASVVHAATPSAWTPHDDDKWLFELRSGQYRLGNSVRGYQTLDGVCVDFADVIMALDLPVRLDKKSRRATGWVFEEARSLKIDRDRGTVDIASKAEKIAPGTIHDTPEGWCIDTRALSKWMSVTLRPDLSNSALVLESETKLPFELQAERRARAAQIRPSTTFDLATLPQTKRDYAMFAPPSVDVVASSSFSKGSDGRTRTAVRYDIFASGEALGTSVEARIFSDEKGRPEALRTRAYRTDPAGELFGPLRATHAAIGDIATIGSSLATASGTGRGAVITNRTLNRPENFDSTDFRGELPQGWDAELYRNGQLLGFASTSDNGRYEFLDVPLLYGSNDFEIVLYGPQGQVRREIQSYTIEGSALQPGEFHYWAGIVENGHDLIGRTGLGSRGYGWRGLAALEYGIDRVTSAGINLQSAQIDGVRRNYVEATVRRSFGKVLGEFAGAYLTDGGFAGRTRLIANFSDTFLGFDAEYQSQSFISERIDDGMRWNIGGSAERNLRVGGIQVPLQFKGRYRSFHAGGDELQFGGRTSFAMRRISLTTGIDWRRTSSSGSQTDSVVANILANARFGKLRVRTGAELAIRGARSTRFTAVAEYPVDENTDIRFDSNYDLGSDSLSASVGVSRQFNAFSASTYVGGSTRGAVSAGVNLSFSFGPDRRDGGIRFSRKKLASRGQALAIVFHDDNNDGRRQADEKLAEGITVTAGRYVVEQPTNDRGRATVDGLEPYQPVLIGIDESSLSSVYIRPSVLGRVVTPRPGVPTIVEIPLVGAGEIEGMLLTQSGRELEGVALELVDTRGTVRATTRSEFDGFFLFDAVPYGRYTVRIATLSAGAAKLAANLSASATLDKDNPRVRLGRVLAASNDALGAPQVTASAEPTGGSGPGL